jgi:hypothetical protein
MVGGWRADWLHGRLTIAEFCLDIGLQVAGSWLAGGWRNGWLGG